jgi:hypothetical protein
LLFKANCRTTAMGIMPHRDIDKALKLVLSLDIPFWPQLPHVSFYEDMYAQFSQHFPGITVDAKNTKLSFDISRFENELTDYSRKMENQQTFALSEDYSVVYHRFLAENLSDFIAIRGQLIGPVSFGFRVTDENDKPIIYNDEVKTILFDFIQRKINVQYRELREKNPNAFVWLDEPGLGWVFSGMSGYTDIPAKQDYRNFLNGVEGLKALHLCANVNLPYLLQMGTELVSFDAYQIECMPKDYAKSVAEFLNSGGVLCWGIVPTVSEALSVHTPQSLADILTGYWRVVAENTRIPLKQIAAQALIAPARCCLKNIGQVGAGDDIKSDQAKHGIDLSVEERVVEKAFGYLGQISEILRYEFDLR